MKNKMGEHDEELFPLENVEFPMEKNPELSESKNIDLLTSGSNAPGRAAARPDRETMPQGWKPPRAQKEAPGNP